MASMTSPTRLLASAAMAAILALSAGGCSNIGQRETTGSVSAASTAPPSPDELRRSVDALGDRYRQNPNDTDSAIIYAQDTQGRFTYLNPYAAEALGFEGTDAKSLVGSSPFDVIAPHAIPDAALMMRRGARRPLDVHTFRLDVRRKDGTSATLEIRARPLWQRGKVTGRVGVARVVDAIPIFIVTGRIETPLGVGPIVERDAPASARER